MQIPPSTGRWCPSKWARSKSLADFKGRSIGISEALGSGGLPLLKALPSRGGIDPEKDVSDPARGFWRMARWTRSRQVASTALPFWASAIVSFESAGVSLKLFPARPEWSTYADFSLGTLAGTLGSDSAMAEAVVRGMAKAVLFTATSPDCARKMFWKSFPSMKAGGNMDEAAKANFDLKQIESWRRQYEGSAQARRWQTLGDCRLSLVMPVWRNS